MKLSRYLVFVLAVSALWLAFAAPGHASQKWAVLVGIDKYAHPGISRLSGADNDAKALAQLLKSEMGFSQRNVLVYTSDADDAFKPTTGNIVNALKYVAEKAGPEDTFVLFFAGHGVSKGQASYLLTHHSELGAEQYTSLSVEALGELLNSIKAKQRLLLVDACRNDPEQGRGDSENTLSGAFARGLEIKPVTGRQSAGAVQATLYSSEIGQRAYEWPGRDRGFFSWFVEEGLKGAAADASGAVTLSSLVAYLQKEVPDNVKKVHGVTRAQTPWAEMRGHDPGNWVIHRVGGARLEALQKQLGERQQQLDGLARMEREQHAAQAAARAEAAAHQQKLAEMDAQIAAMQKRIGTTDARSGDNLDSMLALVREKEKQQAEYERLQEKRRQEEAARKAEMERIEVERRLAKFNQLKADIAKYEEIVASPFGRTMQAQAWQQLVANYPEAGNVRQGDTDSLLRPYNLKILVRDGRFFKYASGIVYDESTGLEWFAGPDRNTNWDEAKQWAEGLSIDGHGWRMPSSQELKGLYQEGKGTRNMTPLLETSGWWVWSGAYGFDFLSGNDDWGNRNSSFYSRAFAVRSRK